MSAAGSGPARGRPFLVAVGALRRRPGSRLEVDVEAPVGDDLAVSNSWVPEGAALRFRGILESTIGGVSVSGVITAPWEGTCRRCLDPANGELEIVVRELCVDEPDPEIGYAVGREWLDLEPIVHDACILELPLAPLCTDACLGLCPQCGANRNREPCSCEASTDPRWAALASLKPEGLEADGPDGPEGPARQGDRPADRTE